MSKLPYAEIAATVPAGWVLLYDRLVTRIPTTTYAAGLALVERIGAAAEKADHHPDLVLRYASVEVQLTSHDTGGVTGRDVAMARTVSDLAADAGLTPTADGLAHLELGLDTLDAAVIAPFWAVVHGHTDRGDEVVDESGRLPTIWFQRSGHDEPRQRWHHDLWVDPSEVQARIDAAVAAGGRLVSDAEAPRFWVLADPEDNMICLCTWQERRP